jgi:hypothetical protein
MSFITGIMSAKAAEDASEMQAAAIQDGIDYLSKMYKANRRQMAPFMTSAKERLAYEEAGLRDFYRTMKAGPGSFAKSDYFKALRTGLGEAENLLEKNALVTGQGRGAVSRKLYRDFALPLTSQYRAQQVNEWLQTKLNPMERLGRVGQSDAANLLSTSSSYNASMGNAIANLLAGKGAAEASGPLGYASAYQNSQAQTAQNVAALAMMAGGYGGGGGAGVSQVPDYAGQFKGEFGGTWNPFRR